MELRDKRLADNAAGVPDARSIHGAGWETDALGEMQ